MSTMSVPDQAIPEGPGSVSGAPNLPEGFTDTFTSRYIKSGDLRQHAVIGGEGPPLLMVHGWPQDLVHSTGSSCRPWPGTSRSSPSTSGGIGLSDKPHDGYDIGTLANDMVALMDLARPRAVRRGRLRHRDVHLRMRWRRITRTGSTGWSSGRPSSRA